MLKPFLIPSFFFFLSFFVLLLFPFQQVFVVTKRCVDNEVYNNKKRKSLGSLNVRNIESFGKVNSEKFKRYLNMPGVKRMNWFLNREAELYYFYFTKDTAKKMISLEPSDEMVDYIKQYIPRGTYQE